MSETTGVDASPPAFGSDLVVRTRFIPPRPKPHYIPRPRLDALLTRLTNYPLTLLKGENSLVLHEYGSEQLDQSGLARILLAVVMRSCQLLHKNAAWIS
ncbi:MAG: hypothetical protein ACE5E7_13455 [Anaerolineae bacterium]